MNSYVEVYMFVFICLCFFCFVFVLTRMSRYILCYIVYKCQSMNNSPVIGASELNLKLKLDKWNAVNV
jgi:hypothetical protein